MENKADVLVVLDNEMVYGLRNGFYPDYRDVQDCQVISIDEFHAQEIKAPSPALDGNDVYMRNPYTKDVFISIIDDDIEKKMISGRAYAVREALVMMGAKSISLEENISDTDSSQASVGVLGKYAGVKGSVNVDYEKSISLTLKHVIESHDESRQPRPVDEVWEYLRTHNLMIEDNLVHFAERLKRDGYLGGEETVRITFCSEIKSALNILSSLNYKVFSSKIDVESKKASIHTVEKILKVTF